MHFSELINFLQQGNSGLESHYLADDPDLVSGASLDQANPNQISFLEKDNSLSSQLDKSNAGAILLPPSEDLRAIAEQKGLAWAVLTNPRLGFAEVLGKLHPEKRPLSGIHPTSVLEEGVVIGDNVTIGPRVFVGKGSRIGSNSFIHPGVVIYQNVEVGEDNEIHANAVIQKGTYLGKRCVVHSNAVIGSEGFGFVPTENGWFKMPQTGVVVIEDDVEIGCGSTIDRPSVGKTLIGSGTKIDNLVQIGHGVTTGKRCALASQVGVAGGAQLGNGVILAGQVGVANRAVIGDQVIASSKSGLHGEIKPGQVVSGYPAIPNVLWLRCSATFSKLPEIAKALRKLQKELHN